MQMQIQQSARALPQPLLVDRPGLGPALRAVLSRCEAAWHDYQERRRRNRALASLETMDAHMLRDIGASESLIWRAVAREDEYQRRIANLCSGCSGRC